MCPKQCRAVRLLLPPNWVSRREFVTCESRILVELVYTLFQGVRPTAVLIRWKTLLRGRCGSQHDETDRESCMERSLRV
jgi:hypothetical protein